MNVYQAVFENAPDTILFVDAKGRILQINAVGEKTLGYAHEELIGRMVESLIPERFSGIHPKHREAFMAAPHTRPMGTGRKLFARRKDGTEFPVDVMLSAASTSEGPIVIAILRDITERTATAERIQNLLERVQLSADAAGMGYWNYDEAADEFQCDEACASLFGGSPEDFRKAEAVRQRIVEEDWDMRRQRALESLKLNGRYESEFRVRHPDGSIHWLGDLGRYVQSDESAGRRFAGVTFDISERKRMEAKLLEDRQRERELMEQAVDGIFLADLQGKYTDVNSAGCRMLGMTREEILGRSILDFIPPEDVARLAQAKELLLGGKVQTSEWSLRRKDGSYLPVEISAKIFPDGRWQAFVRDISERRELENKQGELIQGLNNSLKEIKVLRGLIPICSHCKKIRDDSGFWQQLETYIRDHSNADFSHGICPNCIEDYYPDFAHLSKGGDSSGHDSRD